MKVPTEDRSLASKDEMFENIATMLGGYAAEQAVFGELTTGASDDLKKATELARALVTKYGMSEKVGPIAFGGGEQIFLGREFTAHKDYSESLATLIDSEVSRFMKNALKKAKEVLTLHRGALEALAQKLIIDEKIERDEFVEFVKKYSVQPVTA